MSAIEKLKREAHVRIIPKTERVLKIHKSQFQSPTIHNNENNLEHRHENMKIISQRGQIQTAPPYFNKALARIGYKGKMEFENKETQITITEIQIRHNTRLKRITPTNE